MKFERLFQCFACDASSKPQSMQRTGNFLSFKGTGENYLKNGEKLLEKRISLFNGRTNPIRCFSVDELNSMNVEGVMSDTASYKCVWDGMFVLVKVDLYHNRDFSCREIAVATQMATHHNVHKLVGCCLETEYPVLVYEWGDYMKGTLYQRIFECESRNMEPLKWKDRLRIAWEISHTMSYLHSAFRKTIIHRGLNIHTVFVDQDNVAKLTHFSVCISIPEGEEYVDDGISAGTFGFLPPEYRLTTKTAPSIDVYCFGILFLLLLTGRRVDCEEVPIVDRVREGLREMCLSDIVDPSMITDGSSSNEHLEQELRQSILLSLKCTTREPDNRPTMVDVATELQNIIKSSESMPNSSIH